MKKNYSIILAIILTFFLSEKLISQNTTLVLQDDLNGYSGTRDTYIYDVSPTTVRGSEITIIQDKNTDGERKSLLLFDISSIPEDSSIESAELQFYIVAEGQGFEMHKMLASWNEATVTYSSIGNRHFETDDIDAENRIDSSWPGVDGYIGFITVTIPTSTIQDWVDGILPNYGWLMIATDSDDGQQLASRENETQTNKPKLTISYSTGSSNQAPEQLQTPNQPLINATSVSINPTLEVTVTDPDGDFLNVTFYGNKINTTDDFMIVALPDTQNESEYLPEAFNSQTQWISDHKADSAIVFVTHLGDLVNTANDNIQWNNADAAMDILDIGNVDYSVGPGNHDLGTSSLYPTYFGSSRFSEKSYYGGSISDDNYNNYSLFSAGGMDFIIINLQYNSTSEMLDWADAKLKEYSNRRGIFVQHNILNIDDSWQDETPYLALKNNPNLFLMLCGHMHSSSDGAAYRAVLGDDEHTIHIMLANYQDMEQGNGYMRLLKFSPANNKIYATTYSPYLTTNAYITTYPDKMEIDYNMTTTPFESLFTVNEVASGTTASYDWINLDENSEYQWYVNVSDGNKNTNSLQWKFTTTSNVLTVDDYVFNKDLFLLKNYPNPFNENTHFKYKLPKESMVQLKIYNMLGQEIKTLVNEIQNTELHEVMWSGTDLNGRIITPGTYLYQLKTNYGTASKILIYMK